VALARLSYGVKINGYYISADLFVDKSIEISGRKLVYNLTRHSIVIVQQGEVAQ